MTSFLHSVLFHYLFFHFMTDARYHYENGLMLWPRILGIVLMVLMLAAQLIVMVAALRVYW